jgi:sulfatase modifying factor 1
MKRILYISLLMNSISAYSQIEPEMIFVEGGTFKMKEFSNRDETFKVTVSNYYISKTEITVGQYMYFRDSNYVENNYDRIYKNIYPVAEIDWKRAVEYCEWLSKKTGKKYRLPTEAEWEYAAKGGKKSKNYKYCGSNNSDSSGWYSDNSGRKVHPVAQKAPNELGLYDMCGNVLEWCSDWSASYPIKKQINPKGPINGKERVARGGGAKTDGNCVSCRYDFEPHTTYECLGFRVVCEE